jgi:hypothetical protein
LTAVALLKVVQDICSGKGQMKGGHVRPDPEVDKDTCLACLFHEKGQVASGAEVVHTLLRLMVVPENIDLEPKQSIITHESNWIMQQIFASKQVWFRQNVGST